MTQITLHTPQRRQKHAVTLTLDKTTAQVHFGPKLIATLEAAPNPAHFTLMRHSNQGQDTYSINADSLLTNLLHYIRVDTGRQIEHDKQHLIQTSIHALLAALPYSPDFIAAEYILAPIFLGAEHWADPFYYLRDSTARQAWLAPCLEQHPHLLRDIKTYPTCRAVLLNLTTATHTLQRSLMKHDPTYQELETLLKRFTAETTATTWSRIDNHLVPPRDSLIHTALHWRTVYSSHPPHTSRLLNLALDTITDPDVASNALDFLPKLTLHHPLTTPQLEMLSLAKHVGGIHYQTIADASPDDVEKAMQLFNSYKQTAIQSPASLITFAHDFREPHTGSLTGLIKKSIRHHQELERQSHERRRRELFNNKRPEELDEPTAVPRLGDPPLPGIRRLQTVRDIYEASVEHLCCIHQYSDRARRGECFLFHATGLDGQTALIEMNDKYKIVQHGEGPRTRPSITSQSAADALATYYKDRQQAPIQQPQPA